MDGGAAGGAGGAAASEDPGDRAALRDAQLQLALRQLWDGAFSLEVDEVKDALAAGRRLAEADAAVNAAAAEQAAAVDAAAAAAARELAVVDRLALAVNVAKALPWTIRHMGGMKSKSASPLEVACMAERMIASVAEQREERGDSPVSDPSIDHGSDEAGAEPSPHSPAAPSPSPSSVENPANLAVAQVLLDGGQAADGSVDDSADDSFDDVASTDELALADATAASDGDEARSALERVTAITKELVAAGADPFAPHAEPSTRWTASAMFARRSQLQAAVEAREAWLVDRLRLVTASLRYPCTKAEAQAEAGKRVREAVRSLRFVNGCTLLHLLADRGDPGAVALALDLGVDPLVRNDDGALAWDVANEACHDLVEQMYMRFSLRAKCGRAVARALARATASAAQAANLPVPEPDPEWAGDPWQHLADEEEEDDGTSAGNSGQSGNSPPPQQP